MKPTMSLDTLIDHQGFAARVDGCAELAAELVELFETESPALVNSVREAVGSGDPKAIERAAHTLKGAMSYFYRADHQGAARRLEERAKHGDLANVQELYRELEREVTALRDALPSFRIEAVQ